MSLARPIATVGAATLLSRLIGFVRDMMIAAVLGAGVLADAFFVAFQLPNLARRLMTEGALNAALVPAFLRARSEHGDDAARAVAGEVAGTLTLLLVGAALLLAIAMPIVVIALAPGFGIGDPRATFAAQFARLMLPYVAITGPLAVLMGVLNANRRYAAAAFAAVMFNVVICGALAIVLIRQSGASSATARMLSLAVALAGVAQLGFVGAAAHSANAMPAPFAISFSSDMRRFLARALPGLVASGIPQLTLIAGVMVASAAPGAVSWLYYANRLIELPLGIVGTAVGTVLVPAFTAAVLSRDREAITAAESRGLELALALTLPAAVALAVLAEPIMRVLFERGAFGAADTRATALALMAFSLGLPGHVLVKALSPAFFARDDTTTPMQAALAGLAVALALSLALFPLVGHVGIALGVAAAGWTNAGLHAFHLVRRIGFGLDKGARRRLPRIAVATIVMGAALVGATRFAAPWLAAGAPTLARIGALAALVVLGLALYALMLLALRVARPAEILAALRKSA